MTKENKNDPIQIKNGVVKIDCEAVAFHGKAFQKSSRRGAKRWSKATL